MCLFYCPCNELFVYTAGVINWKFNTVSTKYRRSTRPWTGSLLNSLLKCIFLSTARLYHIISESVFGFASGYFPRSLPPSKFWMYVSPSRLLAQSIVNPVWFILNILWQEYVSCCPLSFLGFLLCYSLCGNFARELLVYLGLSLLRAWWIVCLINWLICTCEVFLKCE
jgi:hypothetical protein